MGAVVIGGGPTGLAAGVVLARQGVEVTVLEKDEAPPPDSVDAAWETWQRSGVAQFRKPHTLLPRGARELEATIPGVLRSLADSGAHEWSGLDALPPGIEDRSAHPDDERFSSLAAHRPTYELAFARVAAGTPLLEVRRGASVERLSAGAGVIDGVPHVSGVQTSDGSSLPADLVIDASGRRSPLPSFLESLGAAPLKEEKEDSKFVYYGRFYRRAARGDLPRPYVPRLVAQGSISILFLPGDNDSWSVTLVGTAADKSLRALRDLEVFERVLRAHAMGGHMIDGDPISDVEVMVGVSDRKRSLRNSGRPVATGVILLGDAWACTNPSLGRGLSMAMMHVNAALPALAKNLDHPAAVFEQWETITNERMAPWHESTLQIDRARTRQMDSIRVGQELPPDQVASERAFASAVASNADLFRANLEMAFCLAPPDDVMSRPYVQAALEDAAPGDEIPMGKHPNRQELEELLADPS